MPMMRHCHVTAAFAPAAKMLDLSSRPISSRWAETLRQQSDNLQFRLICLQSWTRRDSPVSLYSGKGDHERRSRHGMLIIGNEGIFRHAITYRLTLSFSIISSPTPSALIPKPVTSTPFCSAPGFDGIEPRRLVAGIARTFEPIELGDLGNPPVSAPKASSGAA